MPFHLGRSLPFVATVERWLMSVSSLSIEVSALNSSVIHPIIIYSFW